MSAGDSDLLAEDPDQEIRQFPTVSSRRHADTPPRRRKHAWRTYFAAILLSLTLLGVGVGIGWFHSRDYYLICGTDQIRAERGRYWPWGTTALEGDAWKPIPIGADARCAEREFKTQEELEQAFLDVLVDRASRELAPGPPHSVDQTAAELNQALLLTRSEQHSDQRRVLERLLGDVEYWRAQAELDKALGVLEQAADRFDSAAARNPRHQRHAGTWAEYLRRLKAELKAGPDALRQRTGETPATGEPPRIHEPAPATGNSTSRTPDRPAETNGNPTEPVDASPSPDDSHLPRGGVLL
jgi:hypothetical protein